MKHIKVWLSAGLSLTIALLLSGCLATTPGKTASKVQAQPKQASLSQPKSVQEISDEAMHSKGKLTREQINALIRANAKCMANDPRYGS